MEPFKTHQGYVVPLNRSNVDTDAIVPKEFLKINDQTGFGKYLFYNWRFKDTGEVNNDFVLNSPLYQSANILLAKDNFGSGSSREHAVWALIDYGFKVIIACSFADIFYNNSFKNGLLLITQPAEIIQELFEIAAEGTQLTVNLSNQTIITESNKILSFDIDPYHRKMLLEGLDEISITYGKEDHIKQFEEKRANWLTPCYKEIKLKL
ncbi:3-isopropylmalate dehydratase small subunit [Sporosarcina sp. ACRSL]|uniref:3-isopropylmalate dehydratase small subunit n=1 Tax=Sporosarcina sp. ACRSL TaxID=2918215 RepID=UPI001EF4BD97|nr:3-isopropylmalate dehydratase small subunit [Sporosarcina sp. ACRSL]MCG7344013.1 3-isopropylmalate dehydratase small subunit [Sporosarcina sp. ACRSL]